MESVPTVRGIGDLGLLCIQSRVSGADVLNAVAAGSLNELSLWPYLLGFHHSRYLREIMLLLLEFSQILLDTTGLSNRKKKRTNETIYLIYIFFLRTKVDNARCLIIVITAVDWLQNVLHADCEIAMT